MNARAAAIGDCLAALLEASGYEVSREYYINDAGRQVDLLADSWKPVTGNSLARMCHCLRTATAAIIS